MPVWNGIGKSSLGYPEIGLMQSFGPAALFTAIFDFIPNLFPLLTPGKWPTANNAVLSR